MCEKIENRFKWEFRYFGFQIYLSENRLLTMGNTLNVNSLLKVFQRLYLKISLLSLSHDMTNYV